MKCCTCAKSCVKTGEILCETCVKEFEFCTNIQHRVFENVVINSVFKYNDFARKVVKKLKFEYKKDVSKTLAKLLDENFKDEKEYIVVPIPAHRARIKKYGFNHTQAIAKEFCKLRGYKLNKNLLQKKRETLTQHFLDNKQRFENIKDSFRLNLKNYDNKNGENILIIDDITTTGATLDEVIKTFKQKGINNLVCLTVFK